MWSSPHLTYNLKETAILMSTNTYIHLPRNSILAIKHKISNKLRSLHQSRLKPSAHPGHLKTSASPCPRFIGQPEIHNPNIPLHPIMAPRVSTIYNKVRHLTKILHPQLGLKQYHITNLSQFVNIINDIHLGQTDILESFDKVSLFTNIPKKETCHRQIMPTS